MAAVTAERLWDVGAFFGKAPPIRTVEAGSVTPDDFLATIVGACPNGDGGGPAVIAAPTPPGHPVVLRGGVAALAKLWTHQYIRKVVQEGLEVDVDRAPHRSRGLFADTQDQRTALGIEEITIPFEHMLDPVGCLRPDCDHYLQQQSWPFDTLFPVLSREHRTLSCDVVTQMAKSATAKIMWFGTGPTRSQLHFDRKNNLISQVCGTKEVVLFSPSQTQYLYQYSDDTGTKFRDRFSTIDLNRSVADAERLYPLAREAQAGTVVLHPGDVLYLPMNWWHIVASTPDPVRHANIMVCMFFTQGDPRFARFDHCAATPLSGTRATSEEATSEEATSEEAPPSDPDSDDGVPLTTVVIDGVEVEAQPEDLAAAFAFDSELDDDSSSETGQG